MSLESQVQELLIPPLEDLGLSIVRVFIHGSQRKTVEIMIERLDHQPVKVDDCVRASRESAAFLDVEDLIKGAYVLEVTSPGLDRPLTKAADFKRFIGSEVKVEVYTPQDNQRKFIGVVSQADGEGIILSVKEEGKEQKELSFKYSDIKKAKLVPQLGF